MDEPRLLYLHYKLWASIDYYIYNIVKTMDDTKLQLRLLHYVYKSWLSLDYCTYMYLYILVMTFKLQRRANTATPMSLTGCETEIYIWKYG